MLKSHRAVYEMGQYITVSDVGSHVGSYIGAHQHFFGMYSGINRCYDLVYKIGVLRDIGFSNSVHIRP